MQHISFPSISQFRQVIRSICDTAKYHNEPLPVITFRGSIKLHGTNHAVCNSPEGVTYYQSREHIISISSDNAGAAFWSVTNNAKFERLFDRIKLRHTVPEGETIQVFGEFCGGSIQSGVGLNYLPKMFVVFAIRISKDSDSQVFLSEDEVSWLCSTDLACIHNYTNYGVTIDMSCPEQAQATLIALTEQVEKDCPFARQLLGTDFDKELIGEGIVWTTVYKGRTLRFKTKGEKHSVSKVKVLVPVDVEKVNSIREFAANVATEVRMRQGMETIKKFDPKLLGAFIKWVMLDVIKEESDTMQANRLLPKDVGGPVATICRNWFLKQC